MFLYIINAIAFTITFSLAEFGRIDNVGISTLFYLTGISETVLLQVCNPFYIRAFGYTNV